MPDLAWTLSSIRSLPDGRAELHLRVGDRDVHQDVILLASALEREAFTDRVLATAPRLDRAAIQRRVDELALAAGPAKTADRRPRAQSPAEVLDRWRRDGELIHLPTGITRLDELTGGGSCWEPRLRHGGS
ncbi:MAG: hypothetical protein IPM13_19590 [Phycisphaerales bacterium]|nr:hypothetical protein [Phycisphaerales bacterium]